MNGREKGVDEPSTAYVNAVHYIMKEYENGIELGRKEKRISRGK